MKRETTISFDSNSIIIKVEDVTKEGHRSPADFAAFNMSQMDKIAGQLENAEDEVLLEGFDAASSWRFKILLDPEQVRSVLEQMRVHA